MEIVQSQFLSNQWTESGATGAYRAPVPLHVAEEVKQEHEAVITHSLQAAEKNAWVKKKKLANVTSLNVGVTIQFSSVFFSLSFAKQKTKQTILSCYLVFADGTNYTNLTLFSS